MTVVVRDARPDELDAAAAVMLAAYEQYSSSIPAALWKEYADEIVDVRRRLPNSDLIVADIDGRIAGAVTFYRDATLSEHLGWPAGYAEIRLLAVAPSGRGAGIGRLLTDECIRRARENGNPAIGLHTSILMEVAKGMYERMGFARAPRFDFSPDPAHDVTAIAYTRAP